MNAFRESCICPLNRRAIDQSKLAPSMPQLSTSSQPQDKKIVQLEKLIPETVELYEKRFEEAYDLETNELYACGGKQYKKMWLSTQNFETSISIWEEYPSTNSTTGLTCTNFAK